MVENIAVLFSSSWAWLIFVIVGLLLILLELVIGVETTGFDLVFLGSAFVLGGLVTWPAHSWVVTIVVTTVICAAYIAIGRRYVHRWAAVRKSRTNVDAIIGRTGIVLRSISGHADGRVKVGNEDWKARATEDIEEGAEIVVRDVAGATLIVEKAKGG
jgi:inner membrane protein